MPPTKRSHRPKEDVFPDFGALALGPHPHQTMRVLGLVRAGHSMHNILEIGRYQGSWTPKDVERILRTNRVRTPDAPDAGNAPPGARVLKLPATQAAVVDLVRQGLDNHEIADALGLSPNTVRSYVSQILHAAGCRDRVALVIAVLTRTLVTFAEES